MEAFAVDMPRRSALQGFMLVVARDVRLVRRRRMDALLPLLFFVIAASLFPLGVGAQEQTLRLIAPGVVWVCALFSTMLSLGSMYGGDHADGSLEQMLLSGHHPVCIAAAKACAHWLASGLPLLLIAPLVGLLYDMRPDVMAVLFAGLLLGTPILSLLGGIGAALTVGLRQGPVLVLLLILPLCVPVLIFGAGAVVMQDSGMSAAGHLYLLGAMLLLALTAAPFAGAAALRISV